MKSKSAIFNQLYLIGIGLCLILLIDDEKVFWLGCIFIIEYTRRLTMYCSLQSTQTKLKDH